MENVFWYGLSKMTRVGANVFIQIARSPPARLSGNKSMANGGSSPISFSNHIKVEILYIRVSEISIRYDN